MSRIQRGIVARQDRVSCGIKVPWFYKTKADVSALRRQAQRLPLDEPNVRYCIRVMLDVMRAPEEVPDRKMRACAIDVSLNGIACLLRRVETYMRIERSRPPWNVMNGTYEI